MSFCLQTTCLKTFHLWLGWSKFECSRAGTVMEHWQGTYVLKQCLILVLDSRYFFMTFNCWVFCCLWYHVILSADNLSKDISPMAWVSKLECSRAGTVMEHWQGTYVLKQCLILVLDSRYFFMTFNCWVFCCLWYHVILSSDNLSKGISPMAWVE